jgi:oxygen-dependent protoporphyrinogen oxidase
MPESRHIAIVGAGMAGLSAAYELAHDPDTSVTLFEASHRLGGTVETRTIPSSTNHPFVVECGPDSWVSEKRAARDLADELGLADELIHSNDAQRRNYLARTGASRAPSELLPMPDGMRMMVPTRWAPILESSLFSWQARLAYLREPRRAEELKHFAATRDTDAKDADESVADFIYRHFGEEASETIAGPLLAGVFGGNIHTLSARAVLAPFLRMEREHGSLITAVMLRAATSPPEPIFTTLRSGLETLIHRMAATLPADSIHLHTEVTAVHQAEDHRWRLTLAPQAEALAIPSAAPSIHRPASLAFDAIILATPAHVTRNLLSPLDPEAASLLTMETTSAVVAALLWEPDAARHLRIPRGFGFLVPPDQALSSEPSLLAGTFMHQKFPFRAPQGAVFLRGFFGGQAAPRMHSWPDADIAAAARAHFARFLGPLPAPTHIVVSRWPQSLPQYAVGHITRMRALDTRLQCMPGLALIGNAYSGVGLPNLVEQGRAAARKFAPVARNGLTRA